MTNEARPALLADECCDARMVARLRELGFSVAWVRELDRGATDLRVLDLAEAEDRILVTEDLDFGEHAVRSGRPVTGVILLRLGASAGGVKAERLAVLLTHHGGAFAGRYSVLQGDRLRMRPMLRMI